jgi:opacity protein-like surface antigen
MVMIKEVQVMKRLLLVVLALFLVAGVVQAAEVTTTAGTKAMVFQFSGLSSLGLGPYSGVGGSGIGLRYYLSEGTALRPGLTVGFGSTTTKSQVSGMSDDKATNMNFGVNVALEKHLQAVSAISPYLGAGVGAGIFNNKHEPSVASNPPTGTATKITDKGTSFGVFGLGGFEWAWTNGLTLGGEYRFGLNFASGKSETERQGMSTVTDGDESGFNLGFSTASVYLSVNF